jgi:hypothetical protein
MRQWAVVLALAVAGCVNVDRTVLVPGLAPISTEAVTIYMPGDPVPAHTRVAILEAEYHSHHSDLAEMVEKFRAEAARLGADGVVIRADEDAISSTPGMRVMDIDFGGKITTQAYAIRVDG